MHSLLKRQLRRYLGESSPVPDRWLSFIRAVNEAYREFDADRRMLERSLELSSDELIQANSEMRTMFQAIPDLLFRMDREGIILGYAAGDASNFFGDPKELIGKHIQDVPPKEVGDRFLAAIRCVRETNSMAGIEYCLPLDNCRHHFEARLIPLLENQIIAIVRDITDRRLAEEALQLEKERLRLAMEATQQGWFDLNVQTGEIGVSPEYVRIIGYEPEEFDTNLQNWINAIHPDDRDALLKVFRECIESGGTRTMEYRRRTKTGDWKWIRSIGKIVEYDSVGKPLRMAGTHADISERKKAQEALRQSEERFKELAELLPETIFEIDASGNITYVNQNAFGHFGYAFKDFERGLNAFDIVSPEDRPRALANTRRVLSGERIGLSEYKLLRKDGSAFPAGIHTAAKFHDEKPTGLRGVLIDMTETKKLEAELRQAHKMQAIGTLAGGIAHDFNNILAAIIGFTEMALNSVPTSSPTHHYLDQSVKAALRARDLVSRILASSRRPPAQKLMPVEISSVIEEALKLIRPSLPSIIEIRWSIDSVNGAALADPTEVHQVLVNLCINAAQAMEEEGGVLEVGLDEVAVAAELAATDGTLKPGRYLRLTVADTGEGIAPANLERIFDPYFTTKEVGKGSGLGLSVVHGIVKRHDGAIMVDSKPGKGARFHVFFPKLEREGSRDGADDGKPLPGGSERVLFIDDEELLSDMGKRLLEWLGYEVTATTSSLEALRLFRAQPGRFDAVITDYTMPCMTGVDLAKEIMRIRPGIPVILCTGFSERITEEKAKELGIRAFALKPLDLRDFAEIVRRVLDAE